MASIVLIAADHPLMRQALRLAIARVMPASAVVEAGRYEEAIDRLQEVRGDCELVLLDLNMPAIPGFGGLLALRGQFPAVPVIVVSAVDDESTMGRALGYGAAAFVSKSAVAEEIAEAVPAVLAGRT